MTKTFNEINFKYHDYQKMAFDSTARFILLQAGIQSGKTMAGAMWLIKEILHYQGMGEIYDYAIVSPTYKLLQQSTLKKFLELAPSWFGTYKADKSTFILKDGGTIFIRSAEDPDTLEGMTIKAAWLDEAGQMKERVWSIMYGRLNILRGRMIMTTTPYTVCWIDDQVIPQWERGNKDYLVITYESIASPWFPIEEYNHAKDTLSPAEFSRRYKGVLVSGEGLVYDGWSNKYVWDELPAGFHVKEYAAGVDFGYGHPAAIEVGAFSDDFPACCIVDEWYERKKTIEELVLACKDFMKRYNVRIFYADPSRPEYLKQMNHAGIPTMPAKNDVNGGLERVRSLMYSGNLRVLKKCRGLLEERRKYKYPESGIKDDPIKFDDDACFVGDTLVDCEGGRKLIKDVLVGDKLSTPLGQNKVLAVVRKRSQVYDFELFKATPNHHILTDRGSVRIDSLRDGDIVGLWKTGSSSTVSPTESTQTPKEEPTDYIFKGLLIRGLEARLGFYIGMFGKVLMGKSLKDYRLIISTTIHIITTFLILSLLRLWNTLKDMVGVTLKVWKRLERKQSSGIGQKKGRRFIGLSVGKLGKFMDSLLKRLVSFAGVNTELENLSIQKASTVIKTAKHPQEEDVYDLVTEKGLYVANCMVVSNSDAERYLLFSHNVLPAKEQEDSDEDPIWQLIRDERKPKNKFDEEIADWMMDGTPNDEVIY